MNVKEVASKTTSSFIGIKYKKSSTKESKQIISELPTSLIADYNQIQSGSNTHYRALALPVYKEQVSLLVLGITQWLMLRSS
ncbi:hypothetical protein [Moraxella catarrhalis]|uniref:hypothetical protein n=1 Tax=Moraxella catarrhalis TaxID=480 RepID=UPI0007E48436|nr:hypothetical protein [Moraxella catarrhalis]OAV17945.1 hypothetical protein AO375_0165 [Moraxella catarrhalis]